MADGNLTHRVLVGPAIARLLRPRRGERILDLACGNGVASRWLSRRGAKVVAVDFSSALLQLARRRGIPPPGSIRYLRGDLTRERDLQRLGPGRFDAALCNMAIMDVADLGPMARALPRLLVPGGRFVLSVCHPAFNSTTSRRAIEQVEEGDAIRRRLAVTVFEYLTPRSRRGIAMPGQPVDHYYFERSLEAVLRPFLGAGLVLTGLEEPAYPRAMAASDGPSWANYTEIPQVLVARFRAPSSVPASRSGRRNAPNETPARGRSRSRARPAPPSYGRVSRGGLLSRSSERSRYPLG